MRKSLATAMSLALAGILFGAAMPAEAAKQRAEKRFDRLDKDGDGVLGADELARLNKRKFKRLDADKDGYVTADELADFKRARREKKGREVTGRDIKRFEKQSRRGVKRLDKNGDGKISRGEFVDHPHRILKRGDENGDGVVSKQEYFAYLDDRRERRQRKRNK